MKEVLFIVLLFTITTFQVTFAIDFYDILPPLPSWIPDTDFCNVTNCGNGNCVGTEKYPFVKCECKPGWKQPEVYHDVPFQPCVVPNCTMDFTCGDVCHLPPAQAPLPALPKITNPFDPCSYGVCGAGICTRKSNSTAEYKCNCFEGYGNIMNQTWGFCSRNCELKGDCSRLKVTVSSHGDQVTPATNTSCVRDLLPPLPSRSPDTDLCRVTNCGNGTCEPTNVYPFVKCECNPGWKQPEVYYDVPFQPCVVPNCTIDYSCSGASSPAPAQAPLPALPKISEPLNPCSYNVCGAGTCILKSNVTLEYQCNCFKGYGNIMDLTWGFCSKECELQKDCSRLNVSVSNESTIDPSTNDAQGSTFFEICLNQILKTLLQNYNFCFAWESSILTAIYDFPHLWIAQRNHIQTIKPRKVKPCTNEIFL